MLDTPGGLALQGSIILRPAASPRKLAVRRPRSHYGRIEALVDGPCLELFARQRWPGWDAWGDQLVVEESTASAYKIHEEHQENTPWPFTTSIS